MTTRSEPAARAGTVPSWPRGWRAAAGLTAVAAGVLIVTGALLPWVEAFAGLLPISGVRGGNGRVLAAAGAVVAAAGLWQLARGGRAARWLAGLAGFAGAGFSGYLLIQLVRTVRDLGGDSMVIARPGPGLPVVLAGSLAAFATLLFPPSEQASLRRDPGAPAFSWAADRESAGLRRALQVALGAVWLLDAALQYQPYMFTRGFPDMLATAAAGQPGIVAGPVTLTAQAVSASPAAWNAAFATVQLALAVGLLFRATTRAALAGTVVWSLSVWWLGEGLGGVFTTAASPLTGAPGAAVLYALLAVLLWPGGRDERPGRSVADGSPLGRYGKLAWLLLWGGMAWLMVAAPEQPAPFTAGAAVVAFTVAFAAVAAGVLVPGLSRPALAVAAVAAVVVWATGEQFGGILTGQATDPNTGPLLVLVAAAFWPLRGHARLREPAALVRGKLLDFPERARGSTRTFPAALAGAGQANLDDAAGDAGAEHRLGSGRRAPRDAAVGQPEGAAVPRAGQAAVAVAAVGQRPGQVAAPVGEDVDALAVAEHDDGDVTEHPLDRLPAVQFVERHEVVPAGIDEVRDRFGLIGPGGLAVGDVPAEEPAGGDRRQPGEPQGPAAGGDRRRRRVEGDRGRVREGVHEADPHLLLVLLRPVGGAGERGGHRGGQPGQDQPPGCLLVARPGVQQAGGQPGAHRDLHEHRVQRMPEPHAVQRVAHRARRDQPGGALAGFDEPVQGLGSLQVTDEVHARAATRAWPAESCRGGVEVGEVVAESARGAGLAPGRGDDGDR
jgi:hypothetical protein